MAKVLSLPVPQNCIPKKQVVESPVSALSFERQMQVILSWASHRENRTVCVANVHMLMEAHWNPDFARVLRNSDLVTPDGMPLVWMLRLLGAAKQDRVAGMDILFSLCQQAPKYGVSAYFLGSHQAVLDRMKQRLDREFSDLDIAGMEPLPFRPLTPEEDDELVDRINRSGAGIVFVSLGCPKQEKWIDAHRDRINAVTLGVGGVFPVYAGLHRRAPQMMREAGLEWFYRLVQEPRRLWKRYMETIPPFLWLAAKQLAAHYARKAVRVVKSKLERYDKRLEDEWRDRRIGQLLQEAGLISRDRVEAALAAQANEYRNLRFGEILVQQGLVKQETVDFFAEQLTRISETESRHPIGHYLKSAALLDDSQIDQILVAQQHIGLPFGEMAVLMGWVKQETIDLFLEFATPAPSMAPVTYWKLG
ncbi:MAG: WecB/TagA/CpsF family glycosyltransferase [Cyanobacteria bacterium SID2]|nr:WecB/TagA/CpsF family glycosyltransferase [Cyanobacteria bacterium SID2]MBP0003863.1 WecB/TagA/CpsF family glycosyltransferase [Cyanobacteria bacterium SBC]